MKKIIFSILAAFCLAACIEENIDTDQQLQEITFDTDFTAYVTKSGSGEVTQETFPYDFFYVWGYQTNSKGESKQIFSGQPVALINDTWTYKVKREQIIVDGKFQYVISENSTIATRYWIPGCTYMFWAVAPEVHANCTIEDEQLPTLHLEDASFPNDIMYAYLITDPSSSNGSAELQFKHVYSKLSFSFKNSVDPNVTLQVSNITFNPPSIGGVKIMGDEITAKDASSGSTGQTFGDINNPLEFNDEANTDPIIIWPSSKAYKFDISFDVALTIPTKATSGTTSLKGSVTQAINVGTAYNFVIDITPEVINKGETDILVQEIPGWNPNSIDKEQLSIASKLGGEVTLSEDVDISSTLDVLDNLTINLNGKTLSYDGANTLFNVVEPATLTINSNNIETSSIVSTTAAYLAAANEGSNIIINGGNHTTAGSSAYITTGGSISVTDGSFKSAPEIVGTSQTYKTLHIEDDAAGTITVSGGSFYMWDPSNGDTEFDDPKNFLARPAQDSNEKLIIKYKEDWFLVRKEVTLSGDKNQASSDFVDTVKNKIEDGDVINLETDITVPNINDFMIQNKGNVTINMNNNTLAGDASSGYAGLILSNTNITINNGNFTGGGLNIQGAGSKATLNNCNITITSANTSGRHGIYAGTKAEVIFNGGTITFAPSDNAAKKRSYFCADGGTIYVLECKCGAPSTRTETPPLYLVNGGNVIIYRGTFGFNPEQYVTLPEGSTSTKTGNEWIVTSIYITSESGTIKIHGGTYPFDPTPWVAYGYEAIQSGSTWTVQQIAQQ